MKQGRASVPGLTLLSLDSVFDSSGIDQLKSTSQFGCLKTSSK